MSARDRILGRLKNTTNISVPALPDVESWFAPRRRVENLAQRIDRLSEALRASHAEVHVTTAQAWSGLLLEIIAAKGIKTLLVGTDNALADALTAGPVQLLRYEHCIEDWKDQMFNGVDASLTQARSAIAETGTLVLWPDASEPRLMSLVPPIHFVLVDAQTIQPDFSTVIALENWQTTLPTNALLISGPSKTADIQQTLAYGAHGPRELIVLVLQPQGDAS
jgi:L-lactate dehydrogenase complex protein LldG